MDAIDFDDASKLCCSVRQDLNEMLAALRDRSFYDIGFDVGRMASGGSAYEAFIPEFEELQDRIDAKDSHALEKIEWSLCDLVNHYHTLLGFIRSRREHYKKSEDLVQRLDNWMLNSSKLAQMVCQFED
ncbi:MAG: hypothetical protein WC375_02440 [Methanomassiliicoccales archaeon]|jgi:hypothetical protein